jgi:hypothetical protein
VQPINGELLTEKVRLIQISRDATSAPDPLSR